MTEIAETTRTRRLLTAANVMGALALLVFTLLAVLVRGPVPTQADIAITRALQSQSFLAIPMKVLSIPGNGIIPIVLTTVTVLLLLVLSKPLEGTFLAISAGLGAALNTGIKHIVARPRPTLEHVLKLDLVTGFSFPSGHCTFYVCYFGFLAVIASRSTESRAHKRAITALAILPIALIPFSRMYLGAHWASDTLGAMLWSSTWLALVVAVYDAVRQRREARALTAPQA